MRLKSTLFALISASLLGLNLEGCNLDSSKAPTSLAESVAGGFAFGLDSATLTTARPYADSLRVELRQGTQLHSVSAALDSTVRVTGLESGRWILTAGLYAKDGTLRYAGTDTVQVSAGQTAHSDLVLRPAKGSVQITIRIDSSLVDPYLPPTPAGHWLLDEVYGTPVPNSAIALNFDTGNVLWGSDGCNRLSGTWKVSGSLLSLSYANTLMACLDTSAAARLPLALSSVRGWSLTSNRLSLLDSAGRTLATYRQDFLDSVILFPVPLCTVTVDPWPELPQRPSTAPLGTWVLQVTGKDTVYANRFELTFDSAGRVNGTDGCNMIFGGWNSTGSFSARTMTKMACFTDLTHGLPGALWAARNWTLDTTGNDRHLLLLDSLGKTVAVYGTYVLHPTGALVPAADQVISVDSIDTAAIPNRVPVSLVSSVQTDSGLLLSVTLPHPGVKVHLVKLPLPTTQPCLSPTVDSALTEGQRPITACLTIYTTPVPTFVLIGEADPAKASIQVLTPATVLVKDLKPDLCADDYSGYYFKDGFGKMLLLAHLDCDSNPPVIMPYAD